MTPQQRIAEIRDSLSQKWVINSATDRDDMRFLLSRVDELEKELNTIRTRTLEEAARELLLSGAVIVQGKPYLTREMAAAVIGSLIRKDTDE